MKNPSFSISPYLADRLKPKPPVQPAVTKAAKTLIEEYRKRGFSPELINNGDCHEFATTLWDRLWLQFLCNGEIEICTDYDLLGGEYTHTWLMVNDYHYDAECPEGIADFQQLPTLQRTANWARRPKDTKMTPVEILDQGCQTDAEKSLLFVTALGEVLRKDELLDCSSVNIRQVQKKYGLNLKDVENNSPAYKRAVQKEFQEKTEACLPDPEDLEFVRHVLEFQTLVEFGRMRVYGERQINGDPLIVLCTEFRDLAEDDTLWQAIKKIRRQLNAHCWIMAEEENKDRSNPHYGKLERQVELSWRIDTLTKNQVKQLITKIKRVTQPIWNQSGVGVG